MYKSMKPISAIMIPVYAATMYASTAFFSPTKAYAQEQTPAVISQVALDFQSSRYPGIDCLLNDLEKIGPKQAVNCNEYVRQKLPKSVQSNAVKSNVVQSNLETKVEVSASAVSAATSPINTNTNYVALAESPAESFATTTIEAKAYSNSVNVNSGNVNVSPKKKSKIMNYVLGGIALIGLYALAKDGGSSGSSSAPSPATDLLNAAADPCNVDTEVCGSDNVQDDVTTQATVTME